MGLVAWYPLDGNANNYGIKDANLTVTSALTYGNGLFGKGMTTGTARWTAAQAGDLLGYRFSFCAWIKVLDTTNRSMIFGNSGMGAAGNSNNRHYSLFQYPTANDFHWSWQ